MDNINYSDLYEKFYLLIDKMILLIHDNKISEPKKYYINYIVLFDPENKLSSHVIFNDVIFEDILT